MALIGQLAVGITAKTDDFTAGMRKVKTELAETQRSVQQTQTSFASLGTSLTGLAAGVVSIGAITSAVKDLIKTGTEMQGLRASFAAITGSAAAGSQQLQFVTDLANKLGLSLTDLAGAYKGLTAASQGTALAGEKTQQIFTAIASASRTLGLSNEATTGALLAVQQMMSKGTVQAEELRGQLGERLPGAFNIAARAMGVTTAELGKMLESGKILADDFLPKFAAQLQRELGSGAKAAADTAQAAFNRLENEWTLLKDRIAKSGPLVLVANLAGTAAALLTGGTKADLALTKEATRQVGPNATQADIEAAKRIWEEAQLNIRTAGPGSREALEAQARQDIAGLTAGAGFARLEAGAAGGPRKAYDTAQAATEALLKRDQALNTLLDEQKKKQQELAQWNKDAPERLAVGTELAGRKVAELNERLALQRDTLQKLLEITRTPSGALDEGAQKRVVELRSDIRNSEQQMRGLQEAEAAKRKAEQETAAAAKKAAQERQQMLQTDIDNVFKLEQSQSDLMASLDKLAQSYTTVKEVRDADRASMLAAQLVGTPYEEPAKQRVQRIADAQEVKDKLDALKAKVARDAADLEVQETAQGHLERYEEILGMGASKEAREYVTAERTLAPLQGTEFDQRRLDVLRQYAPEFRKMKAAAQEFADSFLSTVQRAADGGIKSFKEFAGSVIMDLSRILQQKYLAPAVGDLVQKGLTAGIKALGQAVGGGGQTVNPTQYSAPIGPQPDGGFAEGGPVMARGFYRVGERGPEVVQLHKGDYVYPHGETPGGAPINVVFNITTPDVGSFKRSSAEIQGKMLAALRSYSRNG